MEPFVFSPPFFIVQFCNYRVMIRYTSSVADLAFSADESFSYTITDGFGGEDTATVNVTVQ